MRTQKLSPLAVDITTRVIEGHPGRDAWNSVDVAIYMGWQIVIDEDSGIATPNRPLSHTVVDKVLCQIDRALLQQWVDDGRLAAPEHKHPRAKPPAWVARLTNVPKVPTGRAIAAIRAIMVDRANSNPDPIARKNQLATVDRELALYLATPNETMRSLAKLHQNVEGAHDMLGQANVRAEKLEKQVETLIANTQQLLQLMYLGDDQPETTPRPRVRPVDGVSAHH